MSRDYKNMKDKTKKQKNKTTLRYHMCGILCKDIGEGRRFSEKHVTSSVDYCWFNNWL